MGKTVSEIIEETKELYCFGEYDEGLARRIEFVKTLSPGEKVISFGIGAGARTAITMGMANPDIYIFMFDYGRHDFKDEDLLIHTLENAHKHGVYNILPWIGEAAEAFPSWSTEISVLDIDTDGFGTGTQLERWAQFVRIGGRIFIQNYGIDKYPNIKKETDEFISHNLRYVLGKQTGQLQEVLVV
jgi:hypothetical protein